MINFVTNEKYKVEGEKVRFVWAKIIILKNESYKY